MLLQFFYDILRLWRGFEARSALLQKRANNQQATFFTKTKAKKDSLHPFLLLLKIFKTTTK
jgi:hypothetical protein